MQPLTHRLLLALALCLASISPLRAQDTLLVATAANVKPAMEELLTRFRAQHPGARVEATYGASGKLSAQIREGAPFDVFLSADVEFPQQLHVGGHAASEPRIYARGRLVLWSTQPDAARLRLNDLTQARFARIALANPRTAPYGARAEEALRAAGVLEAVRERLVSGENIAQAAQFVHSGNAQAGLIALSQALDPELASRGGYTLIAQELHAPLDQAYVITRHGAGNPLARAFADALHEPEARAIFERHGYAVPESR